MPIRPEMKSLYPKDWKHIAARIRERAGNVCEWPSCAAPNGRLIERWEGDRETWRLHEHSTVCLGERCGAIKVVLTVAHLNHDPTDNRDENLKALCQLHHLRLDAKEHAKNAADTRSRRRDEASGQLGLIPRTGGTK